MFAVLEKFKSSEDGAVTVDWVVLTAAVVALAAIAYSAVTGPTGTVGERIGGALSSISVTTGGISGGGATNP